MRIKHLMRVPTDFSARTAKTTLKHSRRLANWARNNCRSEPNPTFPTKGAVLRFTSAFLLWFVVVAACLAHPGGKAIWGIWGASIAVYVWSVFELAAVWWRARQARKQQDAEALPLTELSTERLPAAIPQRPWYSANRFSTVLLVIITVVALPAFYVKTWRPQQLKTEISVSQDVQSSAIFPSFTLFQRADWTSQGNLDTTAPGKCFLGWYNESAPDCNTVPPGTFPCRCDGSWSEEVEDITWQGTHYRALRFLSTQSLNSTSPTVLMIAQAFFYYDSAQAKLDSSRILIPSLWIAIHDPTLTLEQALESRYTRLILLNANGMTGINLGLNRRQADPGRASAYDYDLTFSTVPATDFGACDTSKDDGRGELTPCFLSLFMQFPSFERTVSVQGYAASWLDVAQYAGALFSFFQLLAWIVSSAAMQP